MRNRVRIGGLRIATSPHDLARDETAPGTGVDPAAFWPAFEALPADLAP